MPNRRVWAAFAATPLLGSLAMGLMFSFLDLTDIERPDSSGSDFSHNFISALNSLAMRSDNVWGRIDSFEEREKARQIREAIIDITQVDLRRTNTR